MEVPVCSGYIPSNGWRKKNKCKICGHPQIEHNASAPLAIASSSNISNSSNNSKPDLRKEVSNPNVVASSHQMRKEELMNNSQNQQIKSKIDFFEGSKEDKKSKKDKKDKKSKKSTQHSAEGEGNNNSSGNASVKSRSRSVGSQSDDQASVSSSSSSKQNEITNSNDSSNVISSSQFPQQPIPSTPKKRVEISPNENREDKRRPSRAKPRDEENEDDKDDEEAKGHKRAQTMESKEQVGDYILIEKLGKGAYGVVYKALHLFEGNTVAIKQLNLKGASKEVIEGLQEEINLLQSLDHHNIVRYIGHIRKGKELSIVMEYVENGSLAQMVKKYGRFPEPLAKAYIKKVLEGLVYLHEQGVIHRDIKPDNILITKDGGVKLADFGVSTKLSSLKNNSNDDNTVPAGTPYYMAPEVIEFYGARPESDVWSLGCTVIELLKGEPPYFSHDPFSAMYKMVEDDHPPLPPGITLALNDFLMLCFKKDVNMRTPAKELIKHHWLDAAKAQKQPTGQDLTKAIGEIENYNEVLEKEMRKPNPSEEQEQREILTKSLTLTQALKNKMKEQKNQRDAKALAKSEPSKPTQAKPTPAVSAKASKPAVAPKVVQKPAEDEEENWDDEFGIDASDAAPLKLKLGGASEEKDSKKLPSADTLGFGSLDDIHFGDTLKPAEFPKLVQLKNSLSVWATDDGEMDWGESEDVNNNGGIELDKKALLSALEAGGSSLTDFKEDDDDDGFEKDFGTDIGKADLGGKLAAKLQNKKVQAWDDWEELTIEEDQQIDEKAILREKAQEAILSEIKELLKILKPKSDEESIKKACLDLMDIFAKHPDMKTHLITNHGLLPLIAMLNHKSTVVLNATLRLITQIIDSTEILVNICVMGVIPAIMQCGGGSYPLLTRLYAAYFVQRAISYAETLQMFVACRGLSVLVDFLEPNYLQNKELVHIAVDCISSIFKSQGQTPKNEYFHLFLNVGLLERLSVTMVNILKYDKAENGQQQLSTDEDDISYLEKVTRIFKALSMGDSDVKMKICGQEVLLNLTKSFKLLDPASKEILPLLNMIRNISFDRHALSYLAIFIVPLLEVGMYYVKKNEFQKEIFNQVTHSLFHLCRLYHRPRQEAALTVGLIPFLMFVIANNKPLKEFAVPLMCELAKTSPTTRTTLLENNGLVFYIDLLRDTSRTFDTDALEAIAVCVEHEKEKSETIIMSDHNLEAVKNVFVTAGDHQLINLLDSMLKILTASTVINKSLGEDLSDTSFVSILKNKLNHPTPHARVSLLRTLSALCSKYHDPPHFLKENNLLKVVRFMAVNDHSMLVKNMAVQLLKDGGKS